MQTRAALELAGAIPAEYGADSRRKIYSAACEHAGATSRQYAAVGQQQQQQPPGGGGGGRGGDDGAAGSAPGAEEGGGSGAAAVKKRKRGTGKGRGVVENVGSQAIAISGSEGEVLEEEGRSEEGAGSKRRAAGRSNKGEGWPSGRG